MRPGVGKRLWEFLSPQQQVAVRDDPFLRDVFKEIALGGPETLYVKGVAANLECSRQRVYRRFRDVLGMRPSKFLEMFRLTLAIQFIEEGAEKQRTIAAWTGYANAHTLRRAFVRGTGELPRAYQRRVRGDGDDHPDRVGQWRPDRVSQEVPLSRLRPVRLKRISLVSGSRTSPQARRRGKTRDGPPVEGGRAGKSDPSVHLTSHGERHHDCFG